MFCNFPITDVNKEVYYEFYSQLVQSLPMEDPIFVSRLIKLLPGNLKAAVESKPTQAEATAFFLDKGITPAVEIGDDRIFNILLSVMEMYNSIYLQELAKKIKDKIKSDSVVGK